MASKPLSRLLPRIRVPPYQLPRIASQSPLATSQLPRHYSTTGTSVDPTEISHFDGLASTWWDPYGSSRLLHLMNPIRLKFIQSCLLRGSPIPATPSARGQESLGADPITQVQGRGNPQGLRYLDVGCGGGILAEALARLKSTESVLGVDASTEVLKVAESHRRTDPALAGRLRYLNTTIEGLGDALAAGEKGEREKFDIVTMMEVIEHVPHPMEFLSSAMAHVRPGGWLLLSTIARTWTSYLVTNLIAEDILNIVPRGTHDWNKYINADELEAFFKGQSGWGGDGGMVVMGCIYVPGFGWTEVKGGENVGNYFFGVRRNVEV